MRTSNEKNGRTTGAQHWLSDQTRKLAHESQGEVFRNRKHICNDLLAARSLFVWKEIHFIEKTRDNSVKSLGIDAREEIMIAGMSQRCEREGAVKVDHTRNQLGLLTRGHYAQDPAHA